MNSSENSIDEWNKQMIKASDVEIGSIHKVKVAIIDSGIDYTEDIDVFLRKNFIPGEDDVPVIYEDSCGHGTSIAGIIAAKDNEEGITGINPTVELYSAKVLDSELKAPISRVVEAIYWAISNQVNIINISFGTTTESEALRLAIQDAYNAGILIIAAAGNNGIVEYPAAYDEVVAVGSVDSKGNRSEDSAIGDGLELMAPGDQILSTGSFGGISVSSGTSMAAPHVTGIASVLWQMDLSCTNDFIRKLLDFTANQYGDKIEYGYGLIDLRSALKQYDAFKEIYTEEDLDSNIQEAKSQGLLEDNTSEVTVFDNVSYVVGSWSASTAHQDLAALNGIIDNQPLSANDLTIVKLGAKANDETAYNLDSFTTNPQWHGFSSKKEDRDSDGTPEYTVYSSNYMASYIYLTNCALGYSNNTFDTYSYSRPSQPSFLSNDDYNNIYPWFSITTALNNQAWYTLLSGHSVTDKNKRLYSYGMALHSVTDMFAHCTYLADANKTYISHGLGADSTSYIPNRYACAQRMARIVISHIKNSTAGDISDFSSAVKRPSAGGVYDGTFLITSYATKANAVDSIYYNGSNKQYFDDITN